MVSRLSNGFREDCSKFLMDFAKLGSPSFQSFCQEWKRTNFQYIFCGRSTVFELVDYTSEIFYIVKQFFKCCQIQLERIGAFYLLYALYFKQPIFLFCKIRITLDDWRAMKEFIKVPYNGCEVPQMAAILWKLFKAEAFQFVQEELESGFDYFFHKTLYNRYDYNVQDSFKPYRHLEKELQAMQGTNGIIKAVEILEMGYNEMKEALDDCEASSSHGIVGDKIPQSTLMESLRKDVDHLMGVMGTSSAQEGSYEAEKSVTNEKEDQYSIGTKRYSIRRNAYKRVVKQKKFKIAGQDDEVSDSSSEGSQAPSSPERWNSKSQSEDNEQRRRRAIRRTKTCISDDDDDDAD
ncbi:snRNA-activating protein complex subunit 1 [Anopheles coustani]|uniref:snRNA-activating protein complex subunit 1 n=1 Tax=Anopheles coustani TaxID=139045 RepID=UPI002658C9FF|nr:snRNA-activating protein complex subunit 1 [Anopheles coustani]